MNRTGLKQRIIRGQYGFAIAAVVANVCIAITGSVVRVTGSGLGCSEWPNCLPGSMVPVEHPELDMFHQWIEYGNRLLSGVVGIIGGLCFLAALLSRPHRKRVLWLSAAMMGGVVVQAIIGGITVRSGLLWWTVGVHMVVSPVLAWFAVMLVRSLRESDGPPRPRTHPWVPRVLVAQTVVLVGLLVVGTMVTGAGPHAGDKNTPRLDLPVSTLAHVHAAFLYAFLALLALVGFLLWRGPAPRDVRKRYFVLLGAVLAQGSIGFVQYFTGVPGVLVVLHVFGAMLVTVATASLWAWSRERSATVEATEHEQFAAASL
ncbi:COX15/CtaA family protein [Kibdelosporangium phytohabitans]|uniref:Cytochrome C oxidase n=1 Tax=Kibdelosporangium phytohabitans TaxID=860235 RepID=A0A0N9I768_9PSEU|nr:COX15/CtaA family protein [Kibdelosporangium phytohabitans]ALG11600.1 cytochrome C oxidase [Kibdelosporangium phytohabitans]MBE1462971.1 cytochrome c oxidase assembly protein subunit 15 [Kibdelosporangium phytohabitans]